MEEHLMVRIWSGEHRAYWHPTAAGYTTEVDAAGTYEAKDALARTAHCGPEKRIHIEWDFDCKFLPRDEFERWHAAQAVADEWITMRRSTRRTMNALRTRPELYELLRQAAKVEPTPEQLFEQRVSYVYGNVSMSNPSVTREMVWNRALAELPDKRLLLARRDTSFDASDDDWMEMYGW